jgi:flagellar biosynthesis protein FlhF
LVGPPGAGKTITVAKLAARARLANRTVSVISADSVRAGALEQLSAFTSILGIPLGKARGPDSLRDCIADAQATSDLVFIDTPGLNPFLQQDLDFLRNLTSGVQVEPVFVMAAGSDPVEATEIAGAFAELGATRLLATRLDMTRRLGAVLSAADAGQFMLCEVSITPHIANGLCNITPVSMARLLAPAEPQQEETYRPAHQPERRGVPPPPVEEQHFDDEEEDWEPPAELQQEVRPSFPVLDEWVFPQEAGTYKK